MLITPYVALLAGMSVTMLLLVVLSLRHTFSRGLNEYYHKCAGELTYLLLLISLTVSFLTIEYALTDYGAMMFWGTIRIALFALIPPAVISVYLRFTGNTRLTSRRAFVLMHIVPVFSIGMILTNPFHHLFWTEREMIQSPYMSFIYNYSGPLFWLHAAYCYLLLLGAYGVLFAGIIKKPRIYRGQGYIMLAGACASLLINAVYIFDLFTDLGDLTMPAMFIAAVCLYWAVFIHKPARMIDMARTLVVHELDAPVVIFDDRDILIDANQHAVAELHIGDGEVFRLRVADFYEKLGHAGVDSLDDIEIRMMNGAERFFHVLDKKLMDKKGTQVGRYVVFNDVTHIRSIVQKLEYSNKHDHFTGMLNRNVFREELKRIDTTESLPIALISLNIYGMKFLNTVFGYDFGDRMIGQAAGAVSRLTEGRGFCARISGDEFVIALRNTNEREAAEFARLIAAEAEKGEPVKAGGVGAHISLSCGIAVKENRSENIDLVYKNAASRMFRDKLMEAKNNAAALFEFVKTVLQNNQYETDGHVERIQALTRRMAEHMKFTPIQQEYMRLLSLTHNIGILGTPVELIKKRGALSNEEWEEVRLHTVRGYNIAMLFPDLTPIAEDILRHHERYDGLGYPDGLKGDEIPVGSQIIQLVNYYDELTYPGQTGNSIKPLTADEALERIKKQAGEMVSPALVRTFEEIMVDTHETVPAIVRQEDDAELAEILKLLDMDEDA